MPFAVDETSAMQRAMEAASVILPGTYAVDTLPDPAASLDRYARVTDLFGVKRDLVLASMVAGAAFWQPVRPVFAAKAALAADMTLTALKSPSVMILDGTVPLGTTRRLTLASAMAFPGASFRFRHRSALGSILGALQVLNVNAGTPVALLTGAAQEFIYDMIDGWVQVT